MTKRFKDVVITRHKDKRIVGKTGNIFFHDSKNSECFVSLDTPLWTLNEDGNPELIDHCCVRAKDIKPRHSWKEYVPGFMEDFLDWR